MTALFRLDVLPKDRVLKSTLDALRQQIQYLSKKRPMPYLSSRQQSTSTKSSFIYHLAASSSGKRTPPRPPKHNTDFWTLSSTSPATNPPYIRSTKVDSGEDAFFATTIGGNKHNVVFGVADGVGGWQDQGIDPSDFSHGLCGLMAGTAYLWHYENNRGVAEVKEGGRKRSEVLRPLGLLQTAYDAVMSNPRIAAGGSTASLATIDETGEMEIANLGDSSLIHVAPRKIVHRTPIQTHAFNTPYQLSKVPQKLKAQHAIFGGGTQHFSELPSQADVTRHRVRHGDIVVIATDGVWDNLSPQDALNTIGRVMADSGYWTTGGSKSDPDEAVEESMLNSTALVSALSKDGADKDGDNYLPGVLAREIMREAKIAGLDRRRDGPFAKEVNARYPQEGYEGGKPDDIAVVVCVAVDVAASKSTQGAGEGKQNEKPLKAKL